MEWYRERFFLFLNNAHQSFHVSTVSSSIIHYSSTEKVGRYLWILIITLSLVTDNRKYSAFLISYKHFYSVLNSCSLPFFLNYVLLFQAVQTYRDWFKHWSVNHLRMCLHSTLNKICSTSPQLVLTSKTGNTKKYVTKKVR